MSRWWILVILVIFVAGCALGWAGSQAIDSRPVGVPYPSNYQLPETTAIP